MNDPMFSILSKKKGMGGDPLMGGDSFFEDLKRQQQQRQMQSNPFPAKRIDQSGFIKQQPRKQVVIKNYYSRPSKGIVQTLKQARPPPLMRRSQLEQAGTKFTRAVTSIKDAPQRFKTGRVKANIERIKAKQEYLELRKKEREVEFELAKQRMEEEKQKDMDRTIASQSGIRGRINKLKERFTPRKSIYA